MKRKIISMAMLAAVMMAAFAIVLVVGNKKGLFEKKTIAKSLAVSYKSGNIHMERDGAFYTMTDDTSLKEGDVIYTQDDSMLRLESNQTMIVLNENTEIDVASCSEKAIRFELTQGEVFVVETDMTSDETYQISFAGKNAKIKDSETVFSIDIQDGVQNVNVLAGSVEVSNEDELKTAECGQTISIVDKKTGSADFKDAYLTIKMLDDFVLQQAWKMSDSETLNFAGDDIKAVLEGRKAEAAKAQAALEKAAAEELIEVTAEPSATPKTSEKAVSQTPKTSSAPTASNKNGQTAVSTNKQNTENYSSVKSEDNKDETSQNDVKVSNTPTKSKSPETTESSEVKTYTCAISISCEMILKHLDDLNSTKKDYVPSDGRILANTIVEFTDGETAYDVLKRACETVGIQLGVSYEPDYKAYFIKGLNNIYEEDCGTDSSWRYKVNGFYPNYSCSSYKLKDGDVISWNYSCQADGEDLS